MPCWRFFDCGLTQNILTIEQIDKFIENKNWNNPVEEIKLYEYVFGKDVVFAAVNIHVLAYERRNRLIAVKYC